MTWPSLTVSSWATFRTSKRSTSRTRRGSRFTAATAGEQLYASALYLYSLKPPPNPNRFSATAARGQKIFNREDCATSHTPPLYTNDKLTPVDGFMPPAGADEKCDILPIWMGTDPNLALKTRRGTGYYKVPSLRGVWYRSMFGHSGWSATLEDWFFARAVLGSVRFRTGWGWKRTALCRRRSGSRCRMWGLGTGDGWQKPCWSDRDQGSGVRDHNAGFRN
jgi:hypothetical protein